MNHIYGKTYFSYRKTNLIVIYNNIGMILFCLMTHTYDLCYLYKTKKFQTTRFS